MKKLSLNEFHLSEDEILSRDQLKFIGGGDYFDPYEYDHIYGVPGGNNGNPCPEFCIPMGGTINCLGKIDGIVTIYDTPCQQNAYNGNLHNFCLADVNGSFWC